MMKNMFVIMCAMSVVAAAAKLTAAETVTVSSVDELTNAVARANAGEVDKIILRSGAAYAPADQWMFDNGTAKAFLHVTVDGLVIEGEDASSRKTWTDHAEPVVIDCGGNGSAVYLDESNQPDHSKARNRITLKNIAFTGASGYGAVTMQKGTGGNIVAQFDYIVCTNCVFRQNECTIVAAATAINRGTMWDCFFTNNTASASVGDTVIVKSAKLHDCEFVGNSATSRQIIRATDAWDCAFRSNSAASIATCVDGSNSPCKFYGCEFSENSTTETLVAYGGTFTDCMFDANIAPSDKFMATGTRYGDPATYTLRCTNCVFRRSRRGVCNPTVLYGCRFEDNKPAEGSQIYGGAVYLCNGIASRIEGCTFLRNSSGIYKFGGAIAMVRTSSASTSVVVTNCTFEGNLSFNAYSHGGAICNADNYPPGKVMNSSFPADENPWDGSCLVVDCTFRTNVSLNAAGVYGVKAVNCRFYDNLGSSMSDEGNFACDAMKSHLVGCELTGGDIFDCIVDRCNVHHATNTARAVFRGRTFVTNTLVERCVSRALYDPRATLDAEFVNCTIVTNDMYTFKANSSNVTTTNALSFKNCLFHGNGKPAPGRATDIDAYDAASAGYSPYIAFADTYYGRLADDNLFTPAAGISQCANPKFAKDKYPDTPYWSLLANSPLFGVGDILDFADSDLDLAGRPRVRDGKVDIGCYQCWLNLPGMMMIVR